MEFEYTDEQDKAFPLEELRRLLKKAKEADPSLKQFGAARHKYKWNLPAMQKDIKQFEREIGVTLPDGYRNFLLQAGNGGAGPSYGLFSLKQVRSWLTWEVKPEEVPHLYPEMEAKEVKGAEDWCRGCIPIGSQGDTYFTYLLVVGGNRGRVVYVNVEYDSSWIFFPREPDFLSWYTRWLREVANNYQIFWFGMNLDGEEADLRRYYEHVTTKEEKKLVLSSMDKFPSLSEESAALIGKAAQEFVQESDVRWLIKLLHRVSLKQKSDFLELRWEAGMYDEVVYEVYDSIYFLHEEEMLEHWWKRILDHLPEISQERYYIAFQILTRCSWVTLSDVRNVWDYAKQSSKPELIRAFGRFSDAKEHLDFFLKLLEEREDLKLLNAVLLAVPIVKNKELFSVLERICKEFTIFVNPELTTDAQKKEAAVWSVRTHEEAVVYHTADNILEQVREEFINPKISGIPRPHRLLLQIGDRRQLQTDTFHQPEEIAIHPLIALVIRENLGYLPSTAYDWEKTFLNIKILELKMEKRYIRSGGSTHWIYMIPPETDTTLPKPYYYDVHNWSVIGRMRNLNVLKIEEICVDDFSFLTQCKMVETLSLYNTNFSDCCLLRKMSHLKKVDLRKCHLENQDVLKELGLRYQM